MKKIGFVGMGNMAQALAMGFLRSGKESPEEIFAFAPNQKKLRENAERIGFVPCESAGEAIEKAELVIIACKPYQVQKVLEENIDVLTGKAIVNVAYGWTLDKALPFLPESTHYLHIVPNTPVSICSGILLAEEANTLGEDEPWVCELLGSVGEYVKLPTHLIGAANAVAGCGPAFIAMMIEALGDAGVKHGLSRNQAYTLASGVMAGTAKLQKESGLHPAVLKDQVCSPGGLTIRGVAALEEAGLRNALIKAVDATFI